MFVQMGPLNWKMVASSTATIANLFTATRSLPTVHRARMWTTCCSQTRRSKPPRTTNSGMSPFQEVAKASAFSRQTSCNCARTSFAPANANWRWNSPANVISIPYRDSVGSSEWRHDCIGSDEGPHDILSAPDVLPDSTHKPTLNVMSNKSLDCYHLDPQAQCL